MAWRIPVRHHLHTVYTADHQRRTDTDAFVHRNCCTDRLVANYC